MVVVNGGVDLVDAGPMAFVVSSIVELNRIELGRARPATTSGVEK